MFKIRWKPAAQTLLVLTGIIGLILFGAFAPPWLLLIGIIIWFIGLSILVYKRYAFEEKRKE